MILLRKVTLLAATLATTTGSPAGAQQPALASPLSISDMMKIRHLHDVAISPQGDFVAIVVAEPDFARNSYRFELLTVDSGSGEKKLIDAGTVTCHRCWSPDGSQSAFVRRTAGFAISRYDVASGETSDLATELPAAPSMLKWSPDNVSVGYLCRDAAASRPSESPADAVVEGAEPVADRLFLCQVSGGKSGAIAEAAGHIVSFAWAPDGRRIAYSRQPSARKSDDETDLWLAEVATGACRPLVERPAGDAQPSWSPDGKRIAFFSNDGEAAFFQPYSLNVVDVKTAEVRSLASAVDPQLTMIVGSPPVWSADGNSVFFNAENGMTRHVYRLDLTTLECRQLSREPCIHRSCSWTIGRERLAMAIDSPQMPADLYVAEASDFSPRRLLELNPQLAQKRLGKATTLRWRGASGASIEGLLITPSEREPDQRVPLIVYLHGGPPTNFLQGFAPEIASSPPQLGFCPVHVLAGRGYAVLCPNPSGSDGYGRAYREAVIGRWGELDLADVLAGVDETVRIGVADPKRLELTGYCYGGTFRCVR